MNERDDRSAREQALDTRCSFIVSAPAGAGKTELLAQRALALLAECEEPEEILAITFTRKSAAEMQRRIIMLLQEADDGVETKDEHRRRSLELARGVMRRSHERDWGLREQPARLNVCTIDALCAQLGRHLPLLSGVGAALGVAEQPRELLRLAVRRLFGELEGDEQRVRDDLRRLMLWWSNDARALEDKLVELLDKRDQWLPFLHLDAPFAETQTRLREELLKDLREEACAVLKRHKPELLELGDHASRSPDLAALKGRKDFGACDDRDYWQALTTLLMTKEDKWRKTWNKNHGFPPDDKEAKHRMKELVVDLAANHRALEALRWMRLAPEAEADAERARCVEAMANLLLRLVGHLDVVFIERGEMDYTGVALAAERALGDAEAPGELALRLDYRLRHILVDEFQDTSNVQFRLLERLVEGWHERNVAGERPSTLFLVGDGMQSCYRFRNSDLRLFLRAEREGVNKIKLQPLRLSSNFRSFEEIVDWNDAHFSKALPQADDIALGAVKHSPARGIRGANAAAGVVCELIRYERKKEEELARRREAQRALEVARAAQSKGSVAVLARSRKHLAETIALLRAQNIPFHGEEFDKLSSRAQIADLRSLTRALIDSHDRLAWLALLRSPLCGLGNRSLHKLANAMQGKAPPALTEAVFACEASELEEGERAVFERFKRVVARSLAGRERRLLRRWVEGAWLALGGCAHIRTAADAEDAESFFSMLEKLQSSRFLDAKELDLALDRLFAAGDAQAKLQLMTIHKAKGLEFDTVIIPGLGFRAGKRESPPLCWEPWWNRAGEQRGVLLEIDGGSRFKSSAMHNFLHEREKRREELEEARLLYIGCTRAIRNLHLLGAVSGEEDAEEEKLLKGAGGLLKHLAPSFQEGEVQWLDVERDSGAEAPVQNGVDLWRVAADWSPPPPPRSLAPRLSHITFARDRDESEEDAPTGGNWRANLLNRHLGTVLHKELEVLAKQGVAEIKTPRRRPRVWSAQLRQLGVAQADIANIVERVGRCLDKVLADERGRWILQSRPDAAEEMELLGLDEEGAVRTLIVDRCFVDEDGESWIIDYKSSTPAEGETQEAFLLRQEQIYLPQMRRYFEAYKRHRGVAANLALYFPALPAWRQLRDE